MSILSILYLYISLAALGNTANDQPLGRAVSHPLPSYLRIPLTWYTSTTHSYFPDESAHTIRRVYTSPDDPSSLRHFCGFCGTPLAYWSENPQEESEFISLTLGSLGEGDLRDLEEWGVIPGDAGNELEGIPVADQAAHEDMGEGVPWFESMVSGSRLGKIKRSAGSKRSGGWSVEWEIVEWTDDDGSGRPLAQETEKETADKSAGKRKLEDPADSDTTRKVYTESRG
jgi:hypothetical protein